MSRIGDLQYQQISDSFRKFDQDGDNSISREELREILMKISDTDDLSVIEADIESLMKTCDKDGNGTISYLEFFNTLKNKSKDDREGQILDKMAAFFAKDSKEQQTILTDHSKHYAALKERFEALHALAAEEALRLQKEEDEKTRNQQDAQRIREEQAKSHAEKDELIGTLRKQIEHISSERDAKTHEITQNNETHNRELENLRHQLDEKSKHFDQEKLKFDELLAKEKTGEEEAKKEVEKLTKLLESEREKLANAGGSSAPSDEKLKIIEEKLKNATVEEEKYKTEVEELRKQLGAEKEKLVQEEGRHKHEIDELLRKHAEGGGGGGADQHAVDELRRQLEGDREKLRHSVDEQNKYKQELEELRHQLKSEKEKSSSHSGAGADEGELRKQIETLTREVETLRKGSADKATEDLANKDSQIKQLQRDTQLAEDKISQLEKQISLQNDLLKSGEGGGDGGENKLAIMGKALKEKDEEIIKLKEELKAKSDELEENLAAALEKSDGDETAQNEMRQAIEERDRDIHMLLNTTNAREAEIVQFIAQGEEKDATIAKLQNEIAKLQKEIETATAALNAELADVKQFLETREAEVDNLRRELDLLKAAKKTAELENTQNVATNGEGSNLTETTTGSTVWSASPASLEEAKKKIILIEQDLQRANNRVAELSSTKGTVTKTQEKVVFLQLTATVVLFVLIVGLVAKTRLFSQVEILKKVGAFTRAKVSHLGFGLATIPAKFRSFISKK